MLRIYGRILLGILAGLALFFTNAPAFAQMHTREIRPQDTDPAIDDWLEPHYVVFDADASPRNRLFVFFPGSFGKPENVKMIVETAAHLGLHAIGLRYPNRWTVNTLCNNNSNDLDCHEKVRLEILDGIDRSPLVTITRANSTENRLIALLHYLDRQFPNEGWGQYLDNDGAIRWNAVVVAGHSQGGGHAAIIAKYHEVARLAMFAWTDLRDGQVVPWIGTGNATPVERYFGFNHLQDALAGRLAAWHAFGMDQFGHVVDVDTASAPYGGSHQLVTGVEPASAGRYHGSVVSDRYTPKTADGTPVLLPVWQFLIAGDLTTGVPTGQPGTRPHAFALLENYPNPFNPGTMIRFQLPAATDLELAVFDITGRRVRMLVRGRKNAGSYTVSWDGRDDRGTRLASGVYLYRLVAGTQVQVRRMLLLR